MNSLQALEEQIQQRLKRVEEKEEQRRIQLETKMAELEIRLEKFDQLANELMVKTLEPRMKKLASFFDNAKLHASNEAKKHYSICEFKHSSQYPASVKLTLSIAHDAEIEHLLLVYNLDILPVFFKFKANEQAAFVLDHLNMKQAEEWIDEKILLFVDTYMQLEQTDQYQQGLLVTDPVCGMRFRKSIATAETKYIDHTYFFCSHHCYEKFMAKPQQYVPNETD
ncbi:hypothetical protein MNBD_PLANCTO02-342 [hydrothermal vent metagenome]|uniref:YHS domain-containing protein n=1 Tax=hydrothermal vent metagenome TaxID=652676 RepID=A0A3B1DJH5_9ZZZZ